MTFLIFIILTALFAISKGDHSEQLEALRIPENYLPVTSQSQENFKKSTGPIKQSPDEEIAKLKRKILALSLLQNLKNEKDIRNDKYNRKNEVSEFQKMLHQPPTDLQKIIDHKIAKKVLKKGGLGDFQNIFHDEKFSNPADMIENFLYNYGIYIIIAPLLFYPASLIIGTYGYMAFLLLIFIILKPFFFAIIKLILT